MREELIGEKIKIIESKNKSLIGVEGVVIDETKNLLFIETKGKVKKIIKSQCTFDVEGKKLIGSSITKRPEERIKQ